MKSKRPESYVIQLALSAVTTALVFVATWTIRIPNPMGGYFNLGDVMIFINALTFGPVIGGFAGGIGSALADIIGFPVFAIPTLVIKGIEGLLAGLITNRKSIYRDVFAVVLAGAEMILGYFLAEYYALGWTFEMALAEIPMTNIPQIIIGGAIGIPVAIIIRKRLPEILKY
jgi:uncharacterized membrane protein